MTRKQIEQYQIRRILEPLGIKTWRIMKTRNEVAALLWLACNRLNPSNPYRMYNTLGMEFVRRLEGRRFTMKRCQYINREKSL